MNTFSKWSIGFVVLGILAIDLNLVREGYYEPIFLIGAILSFIAIFKKERACTKFLSLASFFIVLFLVTWFEPFEVIRIMTWLKNIT